MSTIPPEALFAYGWDMSQTAGDLAHLACKPLDGPDEWVAQAYAEVGGSNWCRITLTAHRILQIEVTAGPLPVDQPFFARRAQIDLQHVERLSAEFPYVNIVLPVPYPPLEELIAIARRQARHRLQSPLLQRNDLSGALARPGGQRINTVQMAALYDALLALQAASPIEALADLTGLSPAAVRNKVYRARKEGLLEPTKRGESGGGLTTRGRVALQADEHAADIRLMIENLFAET